jgi:hypothetical protein
MVGVGALTASTGPAVAPASATRTTRMMTVDDTLALLKAGVSEKVILRQVAATGTRLALSVPQILKLKAAGASDALLAALMGPTTAPAAGGARPEGQSIRVYREKNESGEEVLHVTNLDAAGRRIGGELDDWIDSGSPHADTLASRPADRYAGDAAESRQAPVIVNVYPPSMENSAGQSVIMDGGVYAGRLYGGYAGGFGPPRRPACDKPGGALLAEPGLFSRPSAIDTRPYRANTAAQRNRIRFGNR